MACFQIEHVARSERTANDARQRVDSTRFFVVLLVSGPLPSFTLSRVEHEVDREPVQPGRERALATEEVQLFPRANEDVLRQLLGALAVGDHARAEREDAIDVVPVEPLERNPITGCRACDIRITVS